MKNFKLLIIAALAAAAAVSCSTPEKILYFQDIDQVQLHIRTDFSQEDPFSPSTPFIRRTVERLHKAGVIANAGILFGGGDEVRTYLALWDLGFDVFTSDYPEAMFEAIGRLGH